MAKSKRSKVVPLTKVKTKRRELKATLVDTLRGCVERFPRAFLFDFANMRTVRFKDLRQELGVEGRFFLGKNRVMARALGSGGEGDGELRPGLGELAAELRGPVGVLCTSRDRAAVAALFAGAEEPDFARAGAIAGETIVQPAGPLPPSLPHTMTEELRGCGLSQLKLIRGTPTLPAPATLCSEGDVLTPEQCRLLKHFGHQLAVFKLRLLGEWSLSKGAFERIAEPATGAGSRRRAASSVRSGKAGAAGAGGEGGEEEEEEEEEEEGDEEEEEEEEMA